MLTVGTGIQSEYFANQQVMVGVPNRNFMPAAIVSKMIDSEYADFEFVPGETWVSENESGFIVPGIKPNAKSIGVVVRGASIESEGSSASYYKYEDRAVPVMKQGNVWVNVVTAPSSLYQTGVAVNDDTGKATCYDASATAGIFTCGEAGTDLEGFQAITDGSFGITIDGGTLTAITALDFSDAASMDDVADIIEAALTGAYVTYDTANNLFIFTSQTTGASSSIALSADATGTSLYLAAYLNGAGGTATDGEAAGSAPTGYTALPSVSIEKWSAEVTTKVNVSFPVKALTA